MSNEISNAGSAIDAGIWRAIAGAAVKIPPANAYVYYYPQGHLEQSSSAAYPDNPLSYKFTLLRPFIPCRVLSVDFLADQSSDQPYVKFLLQPVPAPGGNGGEGVGGDETDVVSFVKVLTRSDAANIGVFSIPRYCAGTIFPELDYAVDPPARTVVMRDAHNTEWQFHHTYRGKPRRHVLTLGWNSFVIAKRLVAGDSVVFAKKKNSDEMFIGIRRARTVSGDERREALAAMQMAAGGKAFEVVYYPRTGVPEFVVDAEEKMQEALSRRWVTGMRVMMEVEAVDPSRLRWIEGVVEAVMVPLLGMWCGSPWRMLQVRWDSYERGENVTRVNPWQVKYVTLIPCHHPEKRSRTFQSALCYTPYGIQEVRQHPPLLDKIHAPPNHNTGSFSFQLFGKTINLSGVLASTPPRDGK